MDFTYSRQQRAWISRVEAFVREHVAPNREAYASGLDKVGRWATVPLMDELRQQAKKAGLWNLFMPPTALRHAANGFAFDAPGLSNVEYAGVAEVMGRIDFASRVFNCAPPDTGNMELLLRYGSPPQQERWLRPLMEGSIRSAFLMTEPGVASSDATNVETRIERDGDHYVINGRKWWSSGVGDPRCELLIVMGKTDLAAPRHRQQSQILVPRDTAGVEVRRMLRVFGYDDAPHGHAEVVLNDVRVPAENLVLGEGRGFEIAQGRLGPGRIHHCMRTIGAAEAALEATCKRLVSRNAFGKTLYEHGAWQERIGLARMDIETSRLITLKAADILDRGDAKDARLTLAMAKVCVPRAALRILDEAIQAHGGAGVCDDFELASAFAHVRTMRIVDGPDEVHLRGIARAELATYKDAVHSV